MINTKKSLITIVLVTFLFQVVKFYSFYEEYSVWQYGDWIINYQGGFVRRGFIGEILFKLYQITSINLDILILIFVILIITLNSYFLIRSIKYIYNSYINVLIFLSPGFFLYPMMESEIVGRKDILLLFILGFFVFFVKKINSKNLFLLLNFSIVFLTLSHSAFLFYMPYLLFLYFLIKTKKKEKIYFFEFIFTLCLLFLLLVLIAFNQGTSLIVKEICDSAKNFVSDYCTVFGQVQWLTYNIETYLSEKSTLGINYYKYSFIYITSFILVYFFLALKVYKSKFNFNYSFLQKINPLLIFVLLFVPTLPAFILALDWGRYIFLSYSCSFFIFVYCIKENLLSTNYDLNFNKYVILVIIIIYSFLWTFPFYNAKNFKFTLEKPIRQIVEEFN